MKNDFKNKYPLHVEDMVSIFRVEFTLSGPESFEHYKGRVDVEISSLLHATTLLQRENNFTLSVALGVSLRTVQRLVSSVSLPDTFLRYLYFLQV